MDTTPELPTEIRGFIDPRKTCTNVYEILPNETKLYGTESLVDENGVPEPSWKYGYWKEAELLLLAQDPSNLRTIQERQDNGHPDPFGAKDWRVDENGNARRDGSETNRNLHWLAQQIDCRKLYGSAFVGLLKHGSHRSDPLPRGPAVEKYKNEVLAWVLDRTPNLRAIACLEIRARDLVAKVILDRAQTRELKKRVGSAVRVGKLYVIYLRHPSPINHWREGCGLDAWRHWQKLACDCDFPILPEPWKWQGP
ncbi:MAG TPA: hypothetical protein VHE60_10280 [Pyrinomonadaceae bacterium]|nr:hypothetical protein [Pyrinomonadaceae bacterium]